MKLCFHHCLSLLLILHVTFNVCAGDEPKAAGGEKSDVKWSPLFNGKDLEGWKVTNYGGEGEVLVDKGEIVITQGQDLSGIHTVRKDLPTENYEVQFEAMREAGSDFFAAITFPIGSNHCSLILGGWGGGLCGISSLDGMDASENETTSFHQFEGKRWYKVRVRVEGSEIKAWIDDTQIVDTDTEGRRVDVRFEVERSKPFGFSTYATTGRIRKAGIRRLPAAKEQKSAPADAKK